MSSQEDGLIDPSTFVFPEPLISTTITIEFCDRQSLIITSVDGTNVSPFITRLIQRYRIAIIRLHRASWIQTELFLTFPPPTIGTISLIPLRKEETAGRFRVWLSIPGESPQLMWDRKVEGGFPELKILKQRIRDQLQPGKSLGHSDKLEFT